MVLHVIKLQGESMFRAVASRGASHGQGLPACPPRQPGNWRNEFEPGPISHELAEHRLGV
jgi:hypothetical protein